MKTLVVTLIAALSAYIVNTLSVRRSGLAALVVISPIVEELIKTTAAAVSKTSLWQVHLLFGVAEGIHDLLTKGGWLAALLSIAAHTFFGFLTLWGTLWAGLAAGVLLASGAHLLWNAFIVGQITAARSGTR